MLAAGRIHRALPEAHTLREHSAISNDALYGHNFAQEQIAAELGTEAVSCLQCAIHTEELQDLDKRFEEYRTSSSASIKRLETVVQRLETDNTELRTVVQRLETDNTELRTVVQRLDSEAASAQAKENGNIALSLSADLSLLSSLWTGKELGSLRKRSDFVGKR